MFRGPGRYGPFIAGSWVANIGRWFLNLAAAVLVYEFSRSTLLVGAVSVAQFTANIGLGPAAATVVFLLFVLAVATVRPQEHRPPPQGRVRVRDAIAAARAARYAIPLLSAGIVVSGATDMAPLPDPGAMSRRVTDPRGGSR